MHPESLDCSPSAHQRPGACLAAPTAAGQGVGTLTMEFQA